jgi:N-acetylglucosamine-6-sulfatase
LDDFFQGRLRSLQAVDEIVDQVVAKLEAAGQLDNTYIFYTGQRNEQRTCMTETDLM